MTEAARDSGISVDNDNDSLSSTSSLPTLSYVQRLKKQFECLAKEQEREFHSECNWWLHEEVNEGEEDDEQNVEDTEKAHEVVDVIGKIISRNVSVDSETKVYSKQSSIRSQVSRDSSKGDTIFIIPQSTPPTTPKIQEYVPVITFTEFEENHETNDSDSFDSDDEDEDIDEETFHESEYNLQTNGNIDRLNRPVSTSSNLSTKLFNIIRELLENEENYVRSLKAGIDNYMSVFNRKDLPKSLRGQKHRIFANIKSIYNFHQNEFLPSLKACGDDPIQIAEVFTSFVTRDFFYGYIIYAINRKRSELLCNADSVFWKQIQNECHDRLGINSFLLQPIQRLPRYQMLLTEIIKDLTKDLDNSKQAIQACCIAEKSMQRLIIQLNESMSINDIRNCYEIDIHSQGKFKKMDEFEINDSDLRKRFSGKVFVFERGVIYTEALNKEYMEYRGHFGSDKLGIIYKEGKQKFKLFAKKRGQNEVDFKASLKTVEEWNKIITAMLMNFVAEEKQRNATNSRRKNSLISLRTSITNDRNSMTSMTSFKSNNSYRSSTSSGSLSGSIGRESIDPRTSQWYI